MSAVVDEIPAFLLNFGVAGFMLFWFAFRVEKKLERMTEVLEKLCDKVS